MRSGGTQNRNPHVELRYREINHNAAATGRFISSQGRNSKADPTATVIHAETPSGTVNTPLLTVLLDLLPQRLLLPPHQVHDGLDLAAEPLLAHGGGDVDHVVEHGLELVRQPRDDGAAARCGGVVRHLEDVLLAEAPMAPAELAHLVQQLQPEPSALPDGLVVLARAGLQAQGEPAQAQLDGAVAHVLQEGAVVRGPVLAEVLEDLGERGVGHGDLEEVVHEGDHGVVCARLAAEGHGLAVVYALVDDAVREHGLRGDAEDEGAEGGVVARLGLHPHGLHGGVDATQRPELLAHGGVEVRPAQVRRLKRLHRPSHQRARVLDHVDVHEDEPGLAGRVVQAVLEGADQADVVVVHALGRVYQLVVVEGVTAGVLHEWHEAGTRVQHACEAYDKATTGQPPGTRETKRKRKTTREGRERGRRQKKVNSQLSNPSHRPRNNSRQALAPQPIRLAPQEPLMAGLKQVRRQQERVVPVQGVHERLVVGVLVDGPGEVGKPGLDLGAQPALRQQPRLPGRRLDGHAPQDVLEGVEVGGELPDRVGAGQEAARLGHHEGLQGVVVWAAVLQDAKVGGGEVVVDGDGPHCGGDMSV
ncbi:hypothetical protein FJTKL_01146 [Diaporthe vaccinii]|uniref:Uncharacterized protein n=1 Tax=Diaporthe vaccinii TaxID=105482 RepID=A0ABR4F586_9PEZI